MHQRVDTRKIMKPIYIAALAAVTAMITTLALVPQRASSQSYTRIAYEQIEVKPIAVKKKPAVVKTVSADREVWLKRLEKCESGGNPNAINPKDRDGTPSHGLLQFKPSTFAGYTKKYGLPAADLMDPEAQRTIVRHMMDDPNVRWLNEFPDCVRYHVGFPPTK